MAASSERVPSCTGHDGLSSSYKQGNNTILGSSPTLSNVLLGSSPSTAAFLKGTGAKKWFDRLKYDSTLDPSEFTVGYVETEQQAERKSGVEAWSLRQHDHLIEISFQEFMSRCSDDRVPLHRVAFYKHHGNKVWEADFMKKRVWSNADGTPPLPPSTSTTPYHESDRRRAGGATSPYPSGAGSFSQHPLVGTPPSGLHTRRRTKDEGDDFPAFGTPPTTGRSAGAGTGAGAGLRRPSSSSVRAINSSYSRGGGGGAGGLLGGTSDVEGASDDDGQGNTRAEDDDDDLAFMGQKFNDDDDSSSSSDDDGYSDNSSSSEEDYPPGATSFQSQQRQQRHARIPYQDTSQHDHGDDAEEDTRPRELNEECWMHILEQLPTREICMMARVNKWLRQLCGSSSVWRECYTRLYGEEPQPSWPAAQMRRACRRSELRTARWLEAWPVPKAMGNAGTRCLAMDDSKVVSGDGAALRVWSHVTGRRIAALQGHTGRVTCCAFDEERLVSGCSQAVVKVWGMDDLKCSRTLRGHEGPVTGVALLPNGIPVSCSEDRSIQIWDTASSQPLVRLVTGQPVSAMQLQSITGNIIAAAGPGSLQVWSPATAERIHTFTARSERTGQVVTPGVQSASAAADGVGDLHGLDSDDDDADLQAALAAADAEEAEQQSNFTCVAVQDNVLAAGRKEGVVLWDIRTQEQVGCLSSSSWKNVIPPALQTSSSTSTSTRAEQQQNSGFGTPTPGQQQGLIARAAMKKSSFSGVGPAGIPGMLYSTSPPSELLPPLPPNSLGVTTPMGSLHTPVGSFGGRNSGGYSSYLGSSPPIPTSSPIYGSSFTQQHSGVISGSVRQNGSGAGTPARGSSVPPQPPPPPSWGCTALQLDDWKLVASLADAHADRGAVVVHDIRAASSNAALVLDAMRAKAASTGSYHSSSIVARWQEPVMVLHAPARVRCFQFHNELLLAGLDGQQECCLWTMTPPSKTSSPPPNILLQPVAVGSSSYVRANSSNLPGSSSKASQQQGGKGGGGGGSSKKEKESKTAGSLWAEEGGVGMGSSPPDDDWERGGRGSRKKAPKVAKRNSKYPKRTTR